MSEHYHDENDLKLMRDMRKLAPDDFNAWLGLNNIVGRDNGAIPKKYRELIAIAVSCTTQCPYCLEAHAKAAQAAGATREEVVLATRPREVQVLSGLEFYQGFLRLKVGVLNSTLSVVTNATLDLDFDRDVLALDRVEPATYRTEGAKVHLGVIHTGERKTVAYYFDPLICTSSAIDGTCRFRDAQGEARVSQMKRRVAEVVCPLFFTQEVANTAMLKRLVEAELQQFDVKAYELGADAPEGAARALFAEMKRAVLAHDVRLVREHAEEGAQALDAWFYGKTKVTEDEFVIRAAVFPARGRAEFYAASSSMSKVTGLLAELNRQLNESAEAGAVGGLETTDEAASKRAYADPAAVWAMLEDEPEEEPS